MDPLLWPQMMFREIMVHLTSIEVIFVLIHCHTIFTHVFHTWMAFLNFRMERCKIVLWIFYIFFGIYASNYHVPVAVRLVLKIAFVQMRILGKDFDLVILVFFFCYWLNRQIPRLKEQVKCFYMRLWSFLCTVLQWHGVLLAFDGSQNYSSIMIMIITMGCKGRRNKASWNGPNINNKLIILD